MTPYIAAQRLAKTFGRKRVLDDVSFTVEPGDVVGVLGKNGSGKTTLLELMLGFTPATSGSIQIFAYDSFRMPGSARKRIGFVPQQDELLNPLSARDQLRVIASFYETWDSELIDTLSRQWEVDLSERVKNLSVGQRQKLSILLALGHRPDVLVLDEPVASLDPIARRQFMEQIVSVSSDGARSVIFSSHIVSDVERLANKIWILKDGRLSWQGELDALKESIVRVHVRSAAPLATDFTLPNALSMHREERYATAVIFDWKPHIHKDMEQRLGSPVEIESLGLEDIFLELHR